MKYELGLLGQNILYSLSPKIHTFSALALGIECDYSLFDINSGQIKGFLSNSWTSGITGFNVTTPHKLAIGKHVHSTETSSINTVYRGTTGWLATSTDGRGFTNSLKHLGCNINDFSSIFILGAGGVVGSLLAEFSSIPQRPSITIFRRGTNHDAGLIASTPGLKACNFRKFNPDNLRSSILAAANPKEILVVQATNAPNLGDSLAQFTCAFENFQGCFVDLVYSTESDLLRYCRNQKIRCQGGLPMLIEQARLSQSLWWGKCAGFAEVFEMLMQTKP